MSITLPLPEDKKLTVLFRLEPGCLGPKGSEHIEEFCQFAQNEVKTLNSDFIQWQLVPRHDKSLAEIQYKIGNKLLSQDKAQKYMQVLDQNLQDIEEHLQNKLADLIDQYMDN